MSTGMSGWTITLDRATRLSSCNSEDQLAKVFEHTIRHELLMPVNVSVQHETSAIEKLQAACFKLSFDNDILRRRLGIPNGTPISDTNDSGVMVELPNTCRMHKRKE